MNRNGCGYEANTSSRSLKPIPDVRLTSRSNTSLRMAKKPLIGSVNPAGTSGRLNRVAHRLVKARMPSHSPMLPPAMYRLPTTMSYPPCNKTLSMSGSNRSSC